MLENILRIFTTYGYPGIVVIILLGVLVYFFKRQEKGLGGSIDKMADKMSASITQQNYALITSLKESQTKLLDNQMNMFNYLIESNKEREKFLHDNGLNLRKDMLIKVNGILKRISEDADCSRAALIEFHNSKENLNRLPFLWYDIQGEYFKKGKTPIMSKVKDLQAFNLMYVVERVNHAPKHYAILTKDILEDLSVEAPTLYHQLVEELKAKLMIYVGLYNSDNLLVGLLSLEYDYDFDWKTYLDNHGDARLLEQAVAIEQLLKNE